MGCTSTSWLGDFGVHSDIDNTLDRLSDEWKDLSDNWSGVRDWKGEAKNPDWYPEIWETAWEEYIILASQVLKGG